MDLGEKAICDDLEWMLASNSLILQYLAQDSQTLTGKFWQERMDGKTAELAGCVVLVGEICPQNPLVVKGTVWYIPLARCRHLLRATRGFHALLESGL